MGKENMDYISNLRKLVNWQIENFIRNVIHSDDSTEKYVENKRNDKGQKEYQEGKTKVNKLEWTFDARRNQLMKKSPRDTTDATSYDNVKQLMPEVDQTTGKIIEGSTATNDPMYKKNMLDILNTPFDHIDRLVLQDFTKILIGSESDDSNNYFKNILKFDFNDTNRYGVKSMKFVDGVDTSANFDFSLDEGSAKYLDFSGYEYFIDSYTYSPFIDYSISGDNRIGVYSDGFLTKYNTLWFDDKNNIDVDFNRRGMTSNLYKLWNLEEDLYNAKIAFRKAIVGKDTIELKDGTTVERNAKDNIFTFCDHLFKLFSKLSNVRMCHEIYGLKTPHTQWEGILALDIWYNLLYKNIDQEYKFNDDYFNRNPMSRFLVREEQDAKVIYYYGRMFTLSRYDEQNKGIAYSSSGSDTLVWMKDNDFEGRVLVWDSDVFDELDKNAHSIQDNRKDCTSPRGVLLKMYNMITEFGDNSEIWDNASGDFDWFKQKGKVYSDSSKSTYTKYTNLHLGASYNAMTPREYCQLMGIQPKQDEKTGNKTYYKPGSLLRDKEHTVNEIKRKMVKQGCLALQDAFDVIRHKHLFNIYNPIDKKVEEFNPSNVNDYTDSQAAIVIEGIFSELYKYLHFKSTTGEVFQNHINIDNGYKYLTNESLKDSENPISNLYYDESSATPYLSYISKLNAYISGSKDKSSELYGVLDDQNEVQVLQNAINTVLNKPNHDYLDNAFDLCPFCNNNITKSDISPRVFALPRNADIKNNLYLDIVFDLPSYMHISSDDVVESGQMMRVSDYKDNPIGLRYVGNKEGFEFSVDGVSITPHFQYKDYSPLTYDLLGYSTQPHSDTVEYPKNTVFKKEDFKIGQSKLTLYPVWQKKYIVEFDPGDANDAKKMPPIQVVGTEKVLIPDCEYVYGTKVNKSTYHDSKNGKWNPVEYTPIEVEKFRFSNWECTINGESVKLNSGDMITIDKPITSSPVVKLVARWNVAYDMMTFLVDTEPYCDVLIDKSNNQLIYPDIDPTLVDQEFLGWNMVEGTDLGGILDYVPVVCDNQSGQSEIVICETSKSSEPIVCLHEDILAYETSVMARLTQSKGSEFTLVFRYIDSTTKEWTDSDAFVMQENHKIPYFHIHQEIPMDDGKNLVFRYWKKESGNITSSLTMMSDVTLVAVYDSIKKPLENDVSEIEVDRTKKLYEPQSEQVEVPIETCDYAKKFENEKFICTFNKTNPKDNGKTKVVLNCAKINAFNLPSRVENDFGFGTILEISDVEKLLKSLFKVNIDIAHREYYLKKDIQPNSGWWYGQVMNGYKVVCDETSARIICPDNNYPIICPPDSVIDQIPNVCENTQGQDDKIICKIPSPDYPIVCNDSGYPFFTKCVSFEPTVELKFSNFHYANQVVDGKLICTVRRNKDSGEMEWDDNKIPSIVPVNRDLAKDSFGIHYNDCLYCYDYVNSLEKVISKNPKDDITWELELDDLQRYYKIEPLHLYENSGVQSPTDVTKFVKCRKHKVNRTKKQVQTFTSIVKKYRPIIVPKVQDIFNDCDYKTRYKAYEDNSYGVFGWCSIPSKTMVNMEYNEDSIVIPSSYDHYNRIGGKNFLQLDPDLSGLYVHYEKDSNKLVQNIEDSWYFLYDKRDWTYFLLPFFNVKQNNDVYSNLLYQFEGNDTNPLCPKNSNHLNGIIFEQASSGDSTNLQYGRECDRTFGTIQRACQFLANHHHNFKNLDILSTKYVNMISFDKLKELTGSDEYGQYQYNSTYGSVYSDELKNMKFPDIDWVDDFDNTGSYDDSIAYKYNLGQAYAIDDFDDDSVWMYITMVSPLEDLNQVIELEDIMPFVFWWSNRGRENNGPTVDCYGVQGNAKLNYEYGGYCYESAQRTNDDNGNEVNESKWHSVQHTLGVDFSMPENGGVILTQDNSGNSYRGAFDPKCSGTNSKWKVHHASNAFGADQHSDTTADKYWIGSETHGDEKVSNGLTKELDYELNNDIYDSVNDRPMTWNLWNVIRHYAYIKYFINKSRKLGSDESAWWELEQYTKKIVREIYRTFYDKWQKKSYDNAPTFNAVDESTTNDGKPCVVRWTNSFVQISSILERNDREHMASLVLFTGDLNDKATGTSYKKIYDAIREDKRNFRVDTLDGIEADFDEDGIRPESKREIEKTLPPWVSKDSIHCYNGNRFSDLPSSFILSDSSPYSQSLNATDVSIPGILDLDKEYPESEYQMDLVTEQIDITKKWIRSITKSVINHQLFPVYTSMESFALEGKNHRQLTDKDLKSITFQVIPQLYWKYEWSFNAFMIHRVGKLESTSKDYQLYDMLGNVWEWVRDDYVEKISEGVGGLNQNNPIVGENSSTKTPQKVIRGGAFDQFVRKNITSSREGLDMTKNTSKFGTQPNVGFRPSLVFTSEMESGGFTPGEDKVDLFFLFDASASQNNKLQEMMDSAKNIVKMFSATRDNKEKDICRVGSALFLGPRFRMMCSHLLQTFSEEWWYSFRYFSYYDYKRGVHNAKFGNYITNEYRTFDGDQPKFKESTNSNAYKNLMSKISIFRSSWDGSIPVSRPVLRDGSHAGGHGSSGGGSSGGGGGEVWSPTKYDIVTQYNTTGQYVFMHCGVPSWVDCDSKDDKINSKLMLGGCFDFNDSYDFFTYDPSMNGISSFDFPFSYDSRYTKKPDYASKPVDYRGTLSNWWAGDEPMFKAISGILDDGIVVKPTCSSAQKNSRVSPSIPGIGYMFRTGVPRLIFAFSNEFDNNMNRTYSYSNGSTENEYVNAKIVKTKNKLRWNLPDQNPLDPYCLQTLKYDDAQIQNFLQQIKVDDDEVKTSFSDFQSLSSIKDTLQPIIKTHNKVDYTYDVFYTDGYFSLIDVMQKVDEPTNTYIMVSDANAPQFIYDTSDIILTKDSSKEDIKKVSDSIFMYNESRILDDLNDVILPQKIKDKFNDKKTGLSGTYGDLALTNLVYLGNRDTEKQYDENIANVFGLVNPYERTNFAYGSRNNQRKISNFTGGISGNTKISYNAIKASDTSKRDSVSLNLGGCEKIIIGLSYYDFLNNVVQDGSKKYNNKTKSINLTKLLFNNHYGSSTTSDWVKWHTSTYNGGWKSRGNISKKMCMYNLDQNNLQLVGVTLYKKQVGETDKLYKLDNDKVGYYIGSASTSKYLYFGTSDTESWTNWDVYVCSTEQSEESEVKPENPPCIVIVSYDGITEMNIKQFTNYENFIDKSNADQYGQTSPDDYVTLTYKKTDESGQEIISGSLKIINISYTNTLLGASAITGTNAQNVLEVLIKPFETGDMSYPQYFKDSLTEYANKHKEYESTLAKKSNELWQDWELVNFAREFYRKLKKALPVMLSYRYYFQSCDRLVNSAGKKLTDYMDIQNSNVMKPIPVMDVTKMFSEFQASFGTGQFTNNNSFGYKSCIVDLLPEKDASGTSYIDKDYDGLPIGEVVFPIKFTGQVNINDGDEYKTKKIVLSKISEISSEPKEDEEDDKTRFDMGSLSEYYDEITDKLKRTNADPDAILDGSPSDKTQVRLTNGGSYQKNDEFYGIEKDDPLDPGKKTKKYFRNKHFFIDPFELTIAQWCYVWRKDWTSGTDDSTRAKGFLQNDIGSSGLNEMTNSYWKYLSIWEKDEWASLKEKYKNSVNEQYDFDDDEQFIQWLMDNDIYNPLEDTRPYYYASYQKVRGTPQVYQDIGYLDVESNPDASGKVKYSSGTSTAYNYVFQETKKADEYQLDSRMRPTNSIPDPQPISFFDVLNSTVRFKTGQRKYEFDSSTGGIECTGYWVTREGQPNKLVPIVPDKEHPDFYQPSKDERWGWGRNWGVNFDLPTEAQWEYCCRSGSTYAVPPSANLGTNFEEKKEELDLIAWYKYKIIGSKPEPERFCAWRISKMLFGISKNLEQVNNVYEMTSPFEVQ